MIKCDEPMKRSKEKCFTPLNKRWRCDRDCQNCICGLQKKQDGTWEHIRIYKGGTNDVIKKNDER